MRPITPTLLAFAVTLLTLAPPPARAGQPNPKHLAADAKWYAHLDVDAAKETVVFKQLLDAVRLQYPIDDVLAQLKGAIGLNPLTDISGITLYNDSFEPNVAAVLIYAKADQSLLAQAIANNPDYKQETYGAHAVHTWTDANDGKRKVGAFWGDGLILMADQQATLQRALDVLDAKRPAGAAIVKGQPAKGAFLAIAANLAEGKDQNLSRLLSNSEAATIVATESGGVLSVTANLTARSGEQAAQLKRLLDGVKAFGELGAAVKSPTAAGLIRQVEVATDGAHVVATFKHDAKTVLETLKKLDEENKARLGKGAAPAAAPVPDGPPKGL